MFGNIIYGMCISKFLMYVEDPAKIITALACAQRDENKVPIIMAVIMMCCCFLTVHLNLCLF